MYLFPDMSKMDVPGKVIKFIDDLESGKLHREFHYGPDEPEKPSQIIDNVVQPSSPPKSTFEKLRPSPNRYTILKDEL